jgi:hypothetical protein
VSVFGKIGSRLIQPDPATALTLNPIEHLIQGGPRSQSFQLSDQILLQRLLFLTQAWHNGLVGVRVSRHARGCFPWSNCLF